MPIGPVRPIPELSQSGILEALLRRMTVGGPGFRPGSPEARWLPFGKASLYATPAQAARMSAPGPGEAAGANVGGATGPTVTAGSTPPGQVPPPAPFGPSGPPRIPGAPVPATSPQNILGGMIGAPTGAGAPPSMIGAPPISGTMPSPGMGGGGRDVRDLGRDPGDSSEHFSEHEDRESGRELA